MDSFDTLDLIRIKKEKEKAAAAALLAEKTGVPVEKEKKPAPKILEPEIVKTYVPIKLELGELKEKDKQIKVF